MLHCQIFDAIFKNRHDLKKNSVSHWYYLNLFKKVKDLELINGDIL